MTKWLHERPSFLAGTYTAGPMPPTVKDGDNPFIVPAHAIAHGRHSARSARIGLDGW
jgi:hypothetical protein